MKKTVFPAICILISTLFISILPTEKEAAIYEDTVRLHILAPSDSSEDQTLKIYIRDKLLDRYSEILALAKGARDAERYIAAYIEDIESDCRKWMREVGRELEARAELVSEWYDTREYDGFSLPAGSYSSLKITLGEGEGQNWWCVMYPPMCLDIATQDLGYTAEEEALISASGYAVKFKILEIASIILEK